MTFKAAVLIKKKKIEIKNLVHNKLNIGQVLVKIKYTSICSTQLQEYDVTRGKDKFLPHCMGHEATGIVAQVGKRVKKVKVNDKVCLTWLNSKGFNAGPSTYFLADKKKKKVNAGPVNTFSELAVVSENKVIKLKKNANLKKNVLMGCAIPTAVNSILSNLKNFKNDTHLVLGSGGIGLMIIFALKKLGCNKIYVLDNNLSKLKIAKKLGASKILLVKKDNLEKTLDKYKGFFNSIFECTGNLEVFHKSLSLPKFFGGKIIIIGNFKHKTQFRIDPWFFLFGRKILGSWSSIYNYDKHFKKYLKIFKNFKYKLIFGKKTYKLKNIESAIIDFKNGNVIRPLIKF